jgi:hypothetical protein
VEQHRPPASRRWVKLCLNTSSFVWQTAQRAMTTTYAPGTCFLGTYAAVRRSVNNVCVIQTLRCTICLLWNCSAASL